MRQREAFLSLKVDVRNNEDINYSFTVNIIKETHEFIRPSFRSIMLNFGGVI